MCINPLTVLNKSYSEHAPCSTRFWVNRVPCGKCPECRNRRRNDWAIRLYEESKDWQYMSFLTLTYREGELEKVRDYEYNGKRYPLYELCPDDWTRYIDLIRKTYLRKYGERPKLVHFACGEYGSHTLRPHFHICFFFNDPRLFPIFKQSWKKGNVYWRMDGNTVDYHRLNAHDQSSWKIATYISKYISKDDTYYNLESAGLLEDLEKPFIRFSRNIGIRYLAFNREIDEAVKYLNTYPKHDIEYYRKLQLLQNYVHIDPVSMRMNIYGLPQYYKDKLYTTKGLRTSCVLDQKALRVSRLTGEIIKVGFSKKAHQVSRPNGLGYQNKNYLLRVSNIRTLANCPKDGASKEDWRAYATSRINDFTNREEKYRKRTLETHRDSKF